MLSFPCESLFTTHLVKNKKIVINILIKEYLYKFFNYDYTTTKYYAWTFKMSPDKPHPV